MNLYNKMKGLENKYIDLANYYKQELVKQTDGFGNEDEDAGSLDQQLNNRSFQQNSSP